MDNIIIYNTDDGKTNVRLYATDGTVWMTQTQIAELFDSSKQNIGQHLKHCFDERELDKNSVVKYFFTTASDGKKYNTAFYSLDAILAVGFRVRSPRGVQFRRWANTTLKEYMQKGFVIDDERLKNPDGRPDYFDELLARIRDIRASEKRFYQKLGIYSHCLPIMTRRIKPLSNSLRKHRTSLYMALPARPPLI